jgi:Predicted flavin-nucleotide-binding protein
MAELTSRQIENLLSRAEVASLATTDQNGDPYVIPVHFISENDCIYVHSRLSGQKISNISSNPRVSMTIYEMDCVLPSESGTPCGTGTKFQSAVIAGTASVVSDLDKKRHILESFVEKYTPKLSESPMPKQKINGTAIIEIQISEITGKQRP